VKRKKWKRKKRNQLRSMTLFSISLSLVFNGSPFFAPPLVILTVLVVLQQISGVSPSEGESAKTHYVVYNIKNKKWQRNKKERKVTLK